MNPWGNNPWQQQPPSWYQPNAHPHVYVPPSQFPRATTSYWDQSAWNRPPDMTTAHYNEFRSSQYPNLNPILAADTTLVRFDVQRKPAVEILSSTYYANRQAAATAAPVTHMRLFSRAFPWSIDIVHTPGISCEQVWDAVYAALQEPLADSEWGLVVEDEERRGRIEKAAKRRAETVDKDKDRKGPPGAGVVMKRIDWLGEKTLFKGLEKDDEFTRARLLPGLQACSETWVVKFGAH